VLASLDAVAAPVQKDEDAPVKITSPKDDAQVEDEEELEGRIKDGWPVVLVRPLKRDEPWYVQGHVEDVKKGAFSLAIVVGDKSTERGTKFRLCVVVVKDQAEARKYKQGTTMQSLPAGLPRSEFTTVRRK